jgi:hypothetical protein
VIEGNAKVNGIELNKRDALGTWSIEKINITSLSDNMEILLMDVPMM